MTWLVLLSGWSVGICTERLQVRFPVKHTYLGFGSIPVLPPPYPHPAPAPIRAHVGSNQSMCLSRINLPHFLSLSLPLSKK